MSKILQIVLPFWVMAKSFAQKYTDSRLQGLVGLAYELKIDHGVVCMTVHDSKAIEASLQSGVFSLNNM